MRLFRKINWRKGTGSVIVGMFVVMTCFSIALILMEHGNLFNQASRVQMRADAIADGSVVWAQTPLTVDETKLNTMTGRIAAANQDSRNNYTYHQPVITEDFSRVGYVDQIVTVHLDAKTPLLLAGLNGQTEINVGSKVRFGSGAAHKHRNPNHHRRAQSASPGQRTVQSDIERFADDGMDIQPAESVG